MANELKVGDVVFLKSAEDIKMTITYLNEQKAQCHYLNRLTQTFSHVEFHVECLVKVNLTTVR
jgi:uncharacterized protein YodC (DUF2158 family)